MQNFGFLPLNNGMIKNNLKLCRKYRKLSQQDIADILGISRNYYVLMENGKSSIPLEVMYHLSQLFGVGIDELISADLKEIYEAGECTSMHPDLILIIEILRKYIR